jgi:replicative superfamily II helicase
LKLKGNGNTKIIYIAPLKALAKERLKDWNRKFKHLSLTILELNGESTPGLQELRAADILIITPEKWDSISRGWSKRDYMKKVDLVIIDEIHLLGVERGPVLEVIVSRSHPNE